MRYLLDTHTFLWWNTQSSKLPARVLELFQNDDDVLLLSLASIWEIQIKSQLGKLTLPAPLPTILRVQQDDNTIELLPIDVAHILELSNLPNHHRDPFDRLLIAQARFENIALISDDTALAQYSVNLIW